MAIVFYCHLDNNFYKAKNINNNVIQHKIYYLYKSINNNKDSILNLAFLISQN